MSSPWDIRKAKAVIWYWLNYHPAEVISSPMEYELGYYCESHSQVDPDMLVVRGSQWGEWQLGDSASGFAFININTDTWHDANKAIHEWFSGMNKVDRAGVFSFLQDRKGESLSRWHAHSHDKDSPDWASLAEFLKLKGII